MINLLGASAKCLHASTIQVNNDFYYCHVGCWIVHISRLYWKCDLIDDKLIRDTCTCLLSWFSAKPFLITIQCENLSYCVVYDVRPQISRCLINFLPYMYANDQMISDIAIHINGRVLCRRVIFDSPFFR